MAVNGDGNNTFAYFGKQGTTGIKFDPNNFRIESGVRPYPGNVGYWIYTHTSHEFTTGVEIVFRADKIPILGEYVINGVLSPRPLVPNPARDVFQEEWPKPIVNNDPGFQLKRIKAGRPEHWPNDSVSIDWKDYTA